MCVAGMAIRYLLGRDARNSASDTIRIASRQIVAHIATTSHAPSF
jgi:hypothetical protein